jgi:hypothetical protein
MRFGWLTRGHSPSPDGDHAAMSSCCLPHAKFMESMRRFGEHVMPRFR